MAFIVEDLIADVSTSTGTGAFTVAATPPVHHRTFSAVMTSPNDTCKLAIRHRTLNEWETSYATYSAANQLTRTTIINSSNADAAVNFSAGDKDVFMVYPDVATTAQYLSNLFGRALTTDQVNASGALLTLTDAATVAWDMANGFNASLLMTSAVGATRALGNPTNVIAGRTGAIVVTQDATGSRVLTYGANWEAAGGTFPVLSTAANSKDILFYWAQSPTSLIITGILKAVT